MIIMSLTVIARISPKRNPIKSTLTHVMNASTTKPTANVACASSPSNASEDRLARRCNSISSSETATEIIKTVRVMFMSRRRAIATPNNAECDRVSPKYASRRQTIKHPSGPANRATPTPPTTARIKKSSNISFHRDMANVFSPKLGTCVRFHFCDLSNSLICQMLMVVVVFIECKLINSTIPK